MLKFWTGGIMGGGLVFGAGFRAQRGRFALRALCVLVSGAEGDFLLRGLFDLLVFGAVLLRGLFGLLVFGAVLLLGLQISSRLLAFCLGRWTSISRLLGSHWRAPLACAFAVAVGVAVAEAAPAADAAGGAGAPLAPAPLPADFFVGVFCTSSAFDRPVGFPRRCLPSDLDQAAT
jgi:hypothetical protein